MGLVLDHQPFRLVANQIERDPADGFQLVAVASRQLDLPAPRVS
jgi:hypothetical protein